MFLMVVFVLSMSAANSQIYVLGDVTFPSMGALVHWSTMDVKNLGFYNYGIYGNSNSKNLQTLSFATGLSYCFESSNRLSSEIFRVYGGFNYNVWWNREQEIILPVDAHTISFDIGVSKSLGRFSMIFMADILNHSYKPGVGIYF